MTSNKIIFRAGIKLHTFSMPPRDVTSTNSLCKSKSFPPTVGILSIAESKVALGSLLLRFKFYNIFFKQFIR